jgi:hypothetical protein
MRRLLDERIILGDGGIGLLVGIGERSFDFGAFE